MTFWGFVIICGIIAACEMGFLTWWDMKKDKNEILTLQSLLLGIFLVVCPIINAVVCIGCTIYILKEVCPKIVLFGGSKK